MLVLSPRAELMRSRASHQCRYTRVKRGRDAVVACVVISLIAFSQGSSGLIIGVVFLAFAVVGLFATATPRITRSAS
jgi:hypothetical protein